MARALSYQSAERRGRRAERAARWWLRLQGYRILASGYRVAVGEIDIVARRGDILAIVEVKIRADLDHAAYAIGGRQRRRILRATEAFLSAHPGLADRQVRFDAILVAPWRWPRHLKAAWEAQ